VTLRAKILQVQWQK